MISRLKRFAMTTAVAAALLSPLEAKAQQPSVTAHTETGTVTNDLKFQRLRAGVNTDYGSMMVTQDISPRYNGNNPQDLLKIDLGTKAKGTDIGVSWYALGDWKNDGGAERMHYLAEAYATTKVAPDLTAMLDVGSSLNTGGRYWKWAIGSLKHKSTLLEGAIFPQSLDGKTDTHWYGLLGSGFHWNGQQNYAGIGYATGTDVATAVIAPSASVKNLTFATYNRNNGNYWVKSQTALGKPNNGFYSEGMGEFVLGYFSVPPFGPTHFSPLSTKGDVTMLAESKGNSKDATHTLMFGKRLSPVQVAAGISARVNDQTTIDVPVQLYTNRKLGDLNLQLEGAMGLRTRQPALYMQLDYKR